MIQQLQTVVDDLKWPVENTKSDVVFVSDTQSTFVTNKSPHITGAYVKDCDLLAIGDHPSSLVKTLQQINTVCYMTTKSTIIYPLLFVKPVNVVVRGWMDTELDLRELFNTEVQKRLQHPTKLIVLSKTLGALPQSTSLLDELMIKTNRISNDAIQSLLSIPTGTLRHLALNLEHEPFPFIQQLIRKSPATKTLKVVSPKPHRWVVVAAADTKTDHKHNSPCQSRLAETLILNQPLTTSFICSREWFHYDMKSLSRLELVMDDCKWITPDRMSLWWKTMTSRAVNLKSVNVVFRSSSPEVIESVLVIVAAMVTVSQSTRLEIVTVAAKYQLQLSELILTLFGKDRYERLQLLLSLCQTNLDTHRNATICALKCESLLAYMTQQMDAHAALSRRMKSLGTKPTEPELKSYTPLNKWACIDAVTKVPEPTSAPTLAISNNNKETLIVCFPYF